MTDQVDDKTRLRTNRVRSYMTDEELQQFKQLCAAHGTSEAQMIRTLVLAASKKVAPPAAPPEKTRRLDELIHTINALHVQLRKIGGNLNQIAHQANAGRVPVSRDEILAVFRSVQLAGAEVQSAAHRLLT
jgi:hypothetical protein